MPLKRAFLPRLIEVGASCPAALVKYKEFDLEGLVKKRK
jgi:hypothetical protein